MGDNKLIVLLRMKNVKLKTNRRFILAVCFMRLRRVFFGARSAALAGRGICFCKPPFTPKQPPVSAPTASVPSLRTIEAVALKTRPAASNNERKNPVPLVPHSAGYRG